MCIRDSLDTIDSMERNNAFRVYEGENLKRNDQDRCYTKPSGLLIYIGVCVQTARSGTVRHAPSMVTLVLPHALPTGWITPVAFHLGIGVSQICNARAIIR